MADTVTRSPKARDNHPQLLSADLTLPATGEYDSVAIALPIAMGQVSKSKALVIEILKVYWVLDRRAAANIDTPCFLMTQDRAALPTFEDPAIIACYVTHNVLAVNGEWGVQEPYVSDLTDGNGKGILVAVPRLFLAADYDLGNAALHVQIKIMYKVTEVDIAEFVGITQSQVAGN